MRLSPQPASSLRFGTQFPIVPLRLGVDLRAEDVATVLQEKAVYDSLPAAPIDAATQAEALQRFEEAYGSSLMACIRQERGAITDTENLSMAYVLYDPRESAAFILNKMSTHGTEGAKIFFEDAGQKIVRIEQKGTSGPFKNAGEFFLALMRKAKPD